MSAEAATITIGAKVDIRMVRVLDRIAVNRELTRSQLLRDILYQYIEMMGRNEDNGSRLDGIAPAAGKSPQVVRIESQNEQGS